MLENQQHLFNLSEGVTYLNCAYMSPMMATVAQAGIGGMEAKMKPEKIVVSDFFEPAEQLRSEFSKLINCNHPEQVVIVPSVSYGIASIASNLTIPAGSKIILAGEQFPSNVYPWMALAEKKSAEINIISPPEEPVGRGKSWNEKILSAITSDTSVVALSQCHWADGTRFDLMKIRERSRHVGAAMVIDGTQSVGALPFDVQEMQPDALICAGYKWLMGPYSLGLAYYDPKYNEGIPVEDNWINRKNSSDFAGLVSYERMYQPGALRYEVGEHSNFIMVPMQLEAIRQVNAWGPSRIQEYCKYISQESIEVLKASGFLIEEEPYRAAHLFGIRLPERMDVGAAVKKILDENNIYVSIRGSSIRVSPHLYNTKEDFDRLTNTLLSKVKAIA